MQLNGYARMNQTIQHDYQGDSRTVIIHNHIFKNAGSTLDWALARHFKRAFVDHRDNDLMRKGAEYLGKFLIEKPKVRALSTHHLTLPLPELGNSHLLLAAILRDPIERVSSVYSFERKQKNSVTPGSMEAKNRRIKEYVLWRMRKDVGPTIRDFQTRRCLPPFPTNTDVDLDMLERAKHLVDNSPLLGLVELFDEAMVLFEEALRADFPNIDLSYIKQNVGQSQASAADSRIAELRRDLGDEVFDTLLENNQSDIELHAYAMQVVKRRMKETDDFHVKLVDFRGRCSRLSGGFVNKIKALRS